jgi:hypothetical protein
MKPKEKSTRAEIETAKAKFTGQKYEFKKVGLAYVITLDGLQVDKQGVPSEKPHFYNSLQSVTYSTDWLNKYK